MLAKYETSNIDIYYQNVRGLRTKSKDFFCNSSSYEYDIIVLTETWLNKEHCSAEYFDDSFTVFRKDRCDTGSKLLRGGGVLVAIRNKLKCAEFCLLDSMDLECICIQLKLNSNTNAFIYVAYIPPNSDKATYSRHSTLINSIQYKSKDTILVMGDFNIPNVEWLLDTDDQKILLPINIRPDHAADFIADIMEHGLCQINSIRNDDNNLLDLVFTNDFSTAEIESAPALIKIDGYHPPLLLSIEWQLKANMTDTITIRNFKYADYIGMNRYLDQIKFDTLFQSKSLHDKAAILQETLNDAISKFVPITEKRINSKLPWKNKDLQHLKNKKDKEWKRYKTNGDKTSFNKAFHSFEVLNKHLYEIYVDKMASSLKSNPSTFWKFVNSKRCTDNFPSVLSLEDHTTHDPMEQADLFASYFSENFSSQSSDLSNNLSESISGADELFLLDEVQIFDALLNIDTNKGVGEDGIHPLLLKNCAALLCKPIAEIFNESLTMGEFPNLWKKFSVRPIFKSGSRTRVENYRCIAKLPTIAKFFEKLVNQRLTQLVEGKIINHQHGFMKKRSTVTNLLEFTCFASKALAKGAQVDVLYTDFAKAFDKVNHAKLIEKLYRLNLPSNLVAWIASYLSNRRQFVRFKNINSKEFIVNSGVPQGSHIGPTLFNLFINDIAEDINNDVFISLFADDLKIATTLTSNADAENLQIAINKLELWCNANDLHLNLKKCSVLSLTRKRNVYLHPYVYGDHTFKRTTEQKDLGVIIDSKLDFIKHINATASKAASALGFIKRFCYDMKSINTQKTLFNTLVQSILEYCCVVWLPFHDIHKNKIESILRQFSMYVLREYPNSENNYRISSYNERLSKLNMVSLQRRRVNAAVTFLFDLVHNNVHCPLLYHEIELNNNTRNLRQSEFIIIKDSALKLALTAPITQMCKFSNKVSSVLNLPISRNTFKSKLLSINNERFNILL